MKQNIVFPLLDHKNIYVDIRPFRGRCVFALRDIEKGEGFESAPVLPLGSDECPPSLRDHVLAWGDGEAIGLGYASMYNHSDDPNAGRIDDTHNNVVHYVALKNISAGEEVTVKYMCELWWSKGQ